MKKTMIFAIMAMTAIIIAASFDLQLVPIDAIQIPERMIGHELYVCPITSPTWDSIAKMMHPFTRWIVMGFFFAVVILAFNWGWALYQNLLKDSFKREAYKNPWVFTKVVFWMGVVALILTATPNHYRRVHIDGDTREWVLCENNSPNAVAVRATAVHK